MRGGRQFGGRATYSGSSCSPEVVQSASIPLNQTKNRLLVPDPAHSPGVGDSLHQHVTQLRRPQEEWLLREYGFCLSNFALDPTSIPSTHIEPPVQL